MARTIYAHARIEDPRDGSVYDRGDKVPGDLPGLDDLREWGSVRSEPYDPEQDSGARFLTPEEDLVRAREQYAAGDLELKDFEAVVDRYVRASDSGEVSDDSR